MARSAIIELDKQEAKFSSGHFMVFSATERESMHGHDYQVSIAFHTLITHNGLSFDVRFYKERLRDICQRLDYRFILPTLCDFLEIMEEDQHWVVHFNQQKIPFLKQDAIPLPICNVTLEELSHWFLQEITKDKALLKEQNILGMLLRVHNGRGEIGVSQWGEFSYIPQRDSLIQMEIA